MRRQIIHKLIKHNQAIIVLKSARTEGAGARVSGWHSQLQELSFSWGGPYIWARNLSFLKVVENRVQKKL